MSGKKKQDAQTGASYPVEEARQLQSTADLTAAEEVRELTVEAEIAAPPVGRGELPPKPKGSVGGKIFAVLLLLAFVALAWWRIDQSNQPEEPVVEQLTQVSIAQAVLSPLSVSTTITGRVEAADSAMVVAAATAEVKSVYVEEGDYVKKGARLFTLDVNRQSTASLAQLEVAVEMAAEGVASATHNLERTQALYINDAVPLVQLEQAETALINAQLQEKQARAALESTTYDLNDANNKISDASVFNAPIAGYVTEVNVKAGMYPSQTAAAVIIHDTDRLEVKASVSEYLVAHLEEGMPVSFKVHALGETAYTGTLETVALAPASTGLTYPISIAVAEETESNIMPGMFAEITIVSDYREAALCVPSQAVMMRGGRQLVAVLNGDIPTLQEVETGLSDGQLTEILSGLSEGATVITKGQYYVTEGQPVLISAN